MKNLLKQFAGLGIELGNKISDLFAIARLRIAILYFLSGILVLAVGGVILDSIIQKSITVELQKQLSDPEAAIATANQIISDMQPTVWLIRFGIIFAIAIASYFIAGFTLSPVRKMVESQRRFVANASHELRTPIAIMKTNSDVALMNKEQMTKTEALQIIKDNLEEIDRLSNTLQVLLSFSGYETRVNNLIFSHVNLRGIAARAISLFQKNAKKKNIVLSLAEGVPIMIRGNAAALEEMIMNLVRNAIAYTPDGGSVHISVERGSNSSCLLTIRDSGIGISTEDFPHIFEPFYRGANLTVQQEAKGAGLGLAIVREIAKIHNAKINVKSSAHVGTTFIIRFKLA